MVDKLLTRVEILFPGIKIGALSTDPGCECVIGVGLIAYWNRPEPEPDEATLLSVTEAQIASHDFKTSIANKRAEILAAYEAADAAILGGYTQQQKERFYKRDAQGCACHLDPNHTDCTYMDALTEGWEPDPAKRPAKKAELCQRAHDLSASIQAATGLIDGKYERLMADIDALDPNGDLAVEQVKLDAIVW